MLLAAQGATVSTDALIDGLWLDAPPATARKTVQSYVYHLRGRVGDALHSDKSGYSLHVDDSRVDGRRFCEMLAGARPIVATNPGVASDRLATALALWRGNPFADVDGAPVLRPEITRLNELRLVALGDRVDADLALGRHELLVGELESLAVDYPLHERFRAQLMMALYRSGRHGEALRAFSRTRDHFIEEMGIEPSAQLGALELQMLNRDPKLDLAASPEAPGITRAIRGYELRQLISADGHDAVYRGYQRSVGREVAIRVIAGELANSPEFIARYEADVARVARVEHPNIVYVQDTWREPGQAFQVMQWIEGDRLDALLPSANASDWTALEVIEDVGNALGAAHDAGVVHGAVGPKAVLVSAAGDIYLTDFVVGRPAGDAAGDRRAFVELARQVLYGGASPAHGVPPDILYSPAVSSRLEPLLEQAQSGDTEVRPQALAHALRRILGGDAVELADEPAPARSDIRCPYKGLHAFQTEDATDFFGRDQLVDQVLAMLERQRLVAVVGPSGSGKSSLVRAGAVARLLGKDHPPLVAEMYPGAYPFDALADALRSIAIEDDGIADRLLGDERGLSRVLESALPRDGTELVLVIDQFEELFAMVGSEPLRALFLDSLINAATDPTSRLRIVLTLRADFFDRPLRYAGFGAQVQSGLVPVAMPGNADLAAAVEMPAASVGLRIEPGLVGEIVRDVSDEPGGLPLLQYALTELFEMRSRDELTVEVYRASGGVLGALGTRAEALYSELGPAGQRAMHQVFLRLITVEEGADSVRRRVTRNDLAALEVDRSALEDGLRSFGAHRLLTFDSDPVSRAPTVEVAHEALLKEWNRLRDWIEDERDELVLRKRLDAALQEWEESGEDAAFLLRGNRLAQFDTWATTTDMALSTREQAFLQTSREHDEHLALTASARRRRVLLALVVAAMVATGFALYSLSQRTVAASLARDAETARLGSQAGFVVERDRQMALLMAVETYRRDPGFEGLSALQRVLVDSGSFLGTLGAGTAYGNVHWVTANRLLALSGSELHLIDVSGAISLLPVAARSIEASSPAGISAVVRDDGGVVLVDVSGGDIEPFPAADGAQAIAISPDGTLLATGESDGTVTIFDRATGTVTASVLANPARNADEIELGSGVTLTESQGAQLQGITGLAFDPSGAALVSAGGVFVRRWSVAGLEPAGPEIVNSWGPDDFNLSASAATWFWFDRADADTLVVAGETYAVKWQLATGERLSLDTLPVQVHAAAGGATSGLVLTGDGRVLEVDANVGFEFDTHEAAANALAVDATNTRLAVATGDGLVVAALDGARLLARAVPIGGSQSPTLSHDGLTLAAGRVTDGLFDLATEPAERLRFDVDVEIAQFAGSPTTFHFAGAAHQEVLLWTSDFMEMRNGYELSTGAYVGDYWGEYVPAWSGDGGRVARVTRSGRSLVEDTGTDEVVFTDEVPFSSASFDQSGDRVVLVDGEPGATRVVDLSDGSETPFPEMPDVVVTAAFTPDGSVVAIGRSGRVWLLDGETLAVIGEFDEAGAATAALSRPPVVTADGRWMFSASDGFARVWHLESGLQMGKPFPADPGGTPWATADADLLRMVTPYRGDALIWNLDMEGWAALACRAAGRNMTVEEWVTFGPQDAEHRQTCPELD
jgi:DNA-binding SARP family transcriptional activator/WD40 repeat protein/energy-coupling factor transporter ATP-binding protein EcfA2